MAEIISPTPVKRTNPFSSSSIKRAPTPPKSGKGALKRSPSQLNRTKSGFFFTEDPPEDVVSEPESSPVDLTGSDYSRRSSSQSTVATSIGGFEMRSRDEDEDDENIFPSYGTPFKFEHTFEDYPSIGSPDSSDDEGEIYDASQSETSESATMESNHSPDLPPIVDDTAVRPAPSRHVDYLSHKWTLHEVASTWKHVATKRGVPITGGPPGGQSRLENASWRSWAQTRGRLRTVPSSSINWMKDCDTTWLYGPLQDLAQSDIEVPFKQIEPFSFEKKPILKKKTVEQAMLQKSYSSASLVHNQQGLAISDAERQFSRPYLRKRLSGGRPGMSRANSDSGHNHRRPVAVEVPIKLAPLASMPKSDTESPNAPPKKHIHFKETVQQAIILAPEGQEEEAPAWTLLDSDDSDSELLIKVRTRKRPASKRAGSKASLSSLESIKCIAPLPEADIKYHCDRKRCSGDHERWFSSSSSISHSRHPVGLKPSMSSETLQTSFSTETLRPSRPSSNFLVRDDQVHAPAETWKDPTASSATFHLRASDRAMQGYGPGQALELQGQDEDTTAAEFFEEAPEVASTRQLDFSTGGVGGLKRIQSGLFMPFAVGADDEEDGEEGGGGGDGEGSIGGPRVRRGSWLGQVVDSAVETVNTVSDIAQVIWNVGWNTR